ncbi:MAG TPA: adenosylmethionine--8-amino-7-oxononanoate transaminase [Bryobacterales bacterium]|nr:adenosylmethionine--8-amino-7-oxononanoate transaminase [Bryobacterales bacterium]
MSTLVERDLARLWHPYTQMRTAPPPIPIVRGKGVYLYTEDGRKILDGISSWWVNIHGHSHPKLNEALARQAAELEHVIFAGFTHPPAVELAERLTEILPEGLNRIFYSDNGSTAVEVALKMAYQFWRNSGEPERRLFVGLQFAYHGDTVGAMSVSEESVFTRSFEGLMFRAARAHAPYCFRCPIGLERASCAIDCLADLERILRGEAGRVAGVIVEPMLQAAGGMIVWPREFLAGVRKLCDDHGTLMIADEVMTGFGRTGRMFASEHGPVSPDLMCLSKGLSAGYLPLAATAMTDRIYEAFLSDDRAKTFFHGHSFTANPLGCAVALASLDVFREEATLQRVTRLENQLRAGLDPLRSLACVGDVRVIGGVGIVELTDDGGSKADGGYLADIGPRLYREFLGRGVLLRPLGNVLYFMPPYVISETETEWVLGQMHEVLRALPGN